MGKLWKLEYGQVGAGLKRLEDLAGVTTENWKELLDDDDLVRRVGGAFFLESPSLLIPLDQIITVPASAEPWVASDHLKVDTSSDAELPISYLGDIFREKFLAKIEEPRLETKLRSHRLQKVEVDGPILKALGGNDKAETTLRESHHFLKLADRTKWFIFYIEDVDGYLWAVDAGWGDGGWYLDADSVEYPFWWVGGGLVVARDC